MTKRDLFVVVADLDAENVVRSLLCHRQKALRVHLDFCPEPPPNGDLLRYNKRDAGCHSDAVDLLRPVQPTHKHAILLFDHHGSGAENTPRQEIEQELEERLSRSGWQEGHASVLVLEPELESWVWSRSTHVAAHLGWAGQEREMHRFLARQGLWEKGQDKPTDPKRAKEAAMRERRVSSTAQVFSELAQSVSVEGCQDRTFLKFRRKLQDWFGRGTIQRCARD
jgi:hypothetical protein